MPSCILCGEPATNILAYELQVNRIEVLFCENHLHSVYEDMPELTAEGKINVRILPITGDSTLPGPRTTRFPSRI